LGGAGAEHRLDPLYSAEFQVLAIDAAGGRVIVHRYQRAGAEPMVEALDARDGRVLWQRPRQGDESYAALTERTALVQTERTDVDGVFSGWLQAYDAEGGASLWRREDVRFVGLADGLVVVQEQAWPGEDDGFDTSFGNPDDPAAALPQVPHHERYLGLDERTGAPRWTVELAPGTVAGIDMADYPRIGGLSELGTDGVLRVRDVATGAVGGQYRLSFSGVVARHQTGLPGQEVVLAAGRGGAEVFDRASGRRLWRWSGQWPAYNGPVPCLRVHYCVFGEDGTDVLDAATGAVLWRVDGYAGLLHDTGDRLLMYRQVPGEYHPDDVAAFDGDGGALLWHRQGWFLAGAYFPPSVGSGYFVWHPTSKTDAVIGRLDPGDGSVRVIGRAPDFYGSPQCTATGDRLACLAVGVLYVWPLP
jgi:outer membrane protein assembly factor BamB